MKIKAVILKLMGLLVLCGGLLLTVAVAQAAPLKASLADLAGGLRMSGGLFRGWPPPVDGPLPPVNVDVQNKIEITGTVTSVISDTWTIGTTAVKVNAETEIAPGLGVGSVVRVEALKQADGSLLALEISPLLNDEGGEGHPKPGTRVQFTGLLTAKNGEVWTVNSLSVMITTTTQIIGDPAVGQLVKVTGVLNTDGSVLATQIKPASESGDDHGKKEGLKRSRIQFQGMLTAMNGNTWTVNGVSVVISTTTQIIGNPAIGQMVKVKGFLAADGSVLTTQIKPANESGKNDGENDGGPNPTGTPPGQDGNPPNGHVNNGGQNHTNAGGQGNGRNNGHSGNPGKGHNGGGKGK